ncbi:MAG: DUF192 domain-containing protein [Gammaproteobacteria bacterium]|nr:DUF192 domain-containing protein [Gammaproteobacteria bacterium]
MKRFRIGWISVLLLSAATGTILTYWLPAGDSPKTWPLAIDSATGTHHFAVELALTPEAQAQGLMFREDLPDDAGMLFVYDHPDVRTMWMKNTPLSLDMLFVDPDGVIRRIVRDTIPLSPSTIIGPRNILYVLELRAGITRELGIDTGDRIRNLPAPGQSSASSSR